MIDTQLGDYRILRELGAGGMGTVYVGEHVMLGRRVAIKVITADLVDDQLAWRFLNEARAAVQIGHPAIVDVLHFGLTPHGRAYIVMELLVGESLESRLARVGRVEVTEALRVARRVAEALAAAHGVGIVHRDLKPGNIFLVPDPDGGPDRIKLIDFGIAKLAEGLAGSVRTARNAILGTPAYMAPEQARASVDVDARADLYALGCILFEMLAGAPPFVGLSQIDVVMAHRDRPAPALGVSVPAAPAELRALMAQLLAKRPAERPESAKALAEALHLIANPPKRTVRRQVVPVMAVAAALTTAIALAWWRPDADKLAATSSSTLAPQPELATTRAIDAAPSPDAVDATTDDATARAEATGTTTPRPTPPKRAPTKATKVSPLALAPVGRPPAPLLDDRRVRDAVVTLTEAAKLAHLAGDPHRARDSCLAALALDPSSILPLPVCTLAACRLGLVAEARTFAERLPVDRRAMMLRNCHASETDAPAQP